MVPLKNVGYLFYNQVPWFVLSNRIIYSHGLILSTAIRVSLLASFMCDIAIKIFFAIRCLCVDVDRRFVSWCWISGECVDFFSTDEEVEYESINISFNDDIIFVTSFHRLVGFVFTIVGEIGCWIIKSFVLLSAVSVSDNMVLCFSLLSCLNMLSFLLSAMYRFVVNIIFRLDINAVDSTFSKDFCRVVYHLCSLMFSVLSVAWLNVNLSRNSVIKYHFFGCFAAILLNISCKYIVDHSE